MTNHPSKAYIFSLVLLLLLLLSSCASLKDNNVEMIYKVGDTGPAKGLVFFDKGDSLDGWRYLEVAPAKTEVSLQWGDVDSIVGDTSSALGQGKNNTSLIVTSQTDIGHKIYAAKYCEDLSLTGYDDWFLPSQDELDLLYWQLANQERGEFKTLGFGYWSSSEYDETQAWGQGFTSGVQGKIEKTDFFLVRAIRSF